MKAEELFKELNPITKSLTSFVCLTGSHNYHLEDENSDYEYTISPNVSPQWLAIDITDCSAMTIQVSNLGGDTNCIGFADTRFV